MKWLRRLVNARHSFALYRAFLWLALPFGCLFVFLTPPFQSPDEPNHFFRAYQVSEGVFFSEKKEQRLGGELPLSLSHLRDSFSFLKMNYELRLDKNLIFRQLKTPLETENRIFTDFPNTAIYAPTAYFPQAAAIALLRPMGATPLQMLYATRLANLFVWLLLVQAAIRLIPFLKNTLAMLALLPASLVVAASANADVITNGLSWWLVAAFCAGVSGHFKTVTSAIVITANKLIALPLALLVLIRQRQHTQFVFLFSASLFAALAWGYFAQKQFISYDNYHPVFREAQTLNEGVAPGRQQVFILQNPLFFAKTAFFSAIKALPSMAAHFVGKFGWEKNYLHPFWLAALWAMLAVVFFSEKNPLGKRERLLAAGVVVLYAGMFAVTMYALWCPVGAREITNFQGRYFVPIVPVLALVLANNWLEKCRNEIRLGAVFILVFGNLAMVISILSRYYA
ncbi:MAG: DUF2142 domain-containing protein [Saprospiraceae bacterium]